jgi:ribosomal protein S18 acetylase RimI-like enzyme
MEYEIIEIKDHNQKTEYTNLILRTLHEWFGNEKGLLEYVNTIHQYPFWAAFDHDNCVGFFSGKINHNRTGEIYVCGIHPNYHRKGIGQLLYKELEKYCVGINCEYMIVKTVDENDTEESYGKTVKFYEKIGFKKLVTIPEVWDENNPCLIMVKNIAF